MRVERGEAFECCIDRNCQPLDDRVQAQFDREWDCPHCSGDLQIIRRGGLLAGCENYPECDTGYAFPSGIVIGDCPCGLPLFETDSGRRCLDSGCDRME
jgi:DNA topoisomerase-1